MTYMTVESVKRPLELFKQYDADTQLTLLWLGYLDIKKELTPAPDYKTENLAGALFDRFKNMSYDDQLQGMRDIAGNAATPLSRAYGSLSPSAKLDIWLMLAQGMEDGTIVAYPTDYQLPEATNEFTSTIKTLDFEQRINFVRNAIADMGSSLPNL
jgi:hypothetical protein